MWCARVGGVTAYQRACARVELPVCPARLPCASQYTTHIMRHGRVPWPSVYIVRSQHDYCALRMHSVILVGMAAVRVVKRMLGVGGDGGGDVGMMMGIMATINDEEIVKLADFLAK